MIKIKMEFDMRWKYVFDADDQWNGNVRAWNIARIPAPGKDFVNIDPITLGDFQDEYGNFRYKNNGKGEPILKPIEPTPEQIAEKEKQEKIEQIAQDLPIIFVENNITLTDLVNKIKESKNKAEIKTED